jgi:hypothetical protein
VEGEGPGQDILNSILSSSSLVVTATSSSLTNGSKCTSGDSGASSPASYITHINQSLTHTLHNAVNFFGGGLNTSSLFSSSSSFLVRAKEDAAPKPPAVVGALHALALLVPNLNPPNKGCVVFSTPSESCFFGVVVAEPKEPKIFVDFSAALVAAGLTVSKGVNIIMGAAAGDDEADSSCAPSGSGSFSCSVVVARGVDETSEATGASSLLTLDMVGDGKSCWGLGGNDGGYALTRTGKWEKGKKEKDTHLRD